MEKAIATVTIRGLRPLLWHHFTEDAISLERKERTGVAGNDPDEWRKTVLVEEDGRLYVTNDYVFGTIIDGARYVKKGRGNIRTLVAATLNVLEKKIYIQDRLLPDPLERDPELPVYLDVKSTVNPTTKKRNIRYRVACAPGWNCNFTITWDPSIVQRAQMEQCCRDAGALAGIGDGRAIGQGRFEVVSFTNS